MKRSLAYMLTVVAWKGLCRIAMGQILELNLSFRFGIQNFKWQINLYWCLPWEPFILWFHWARHRGDHLVILHDFLFFGGAVCNLTCWKFPGFLLRWKQTNKYNLFYKIFYILLNWEKLFQVNIFACIDFNCKQATGKTVCLLLSFICLSPQKCQNHKGVGIHSKIKYSQNWVHWDEFCTM